MKFIELYEETKILSSKEVEKDLEIIKFKNDKSDVFVLEAKFYKPSKTLQIEFYTESGTMDMSFLTRENKENIKIISSIIEILKNKINSNKNIKEISFYALEDVSPENAEKRLKFYETILKRLSKYGIYYKKIIKDGRFFTIVL